MENCYQLVPESDSPRLRREFETSDFDDWLARLSDQGLCQMLVSLLLKLERMLRAPLAGPRVVELLRRLTGLIRDLADDLPQQPPRLGAPDPALGLSLEQRLCCVTFQNLKRGLRSLDQSAPGTVADRAAARAWLVGQMFVWLGRQIEHGADRGPLWPAGTWQELHDLYYYYANRMAGRDPLDLPAAADPHHEVYADQGAVYKRLLLVGLCAQQQAAALLAPAHARQFADWVQETQLHDPELYRGVLGTCLVEVASDAPPRLVAGSLGPVNAAWVLSLPATFHAALAGANAV